MDIYQVKSTVICFTKLKFGVLRLLLSLNGFVMTKVSIALQNAQLAIANALVLLAIIFVLFGQWNAPKKKE